MAFRQRILRGLGRVACLCGLACTSGTVFAQQCLAANDNPLAPVRKLFVIAGQSNAVGLASVKDITQGPNNYVQEDTVFPNVKIYGIFNAEPDIAGKDDAIQSRTVSWSRFATWQTARPGFGYKNVANVPQFFPPGSGAQDMFGPELYLARYLNDRSPKDHYIVKLAISNTSLSPVADADNWSAGSRLYQELMKMIADAHNSRRADVNLRVAGIFFMQGETDAMHEISARNYEKNIKGFIRRFRQDVHVMNCAGTKDVPVVLGRIQKNSAWAHAKAVRRGQQNAARELPGVSLVNTDDFSRWLDASGLHFNEYGQAHLGKRVYQAFFPPR
ncbi:sialate O-acetylesterase [Acidovorax sp. Root267]|uniref:sialate O-acetylesterase n=1 Tax=Acidovorax sp. Root267 TaxID=1736505 RepID=UPI0009E85536|nr:sialate O-acetylesterase [Acidovorax sp. Root267]